MEGILDHAVLHCRSMLFFFPETPYFQGMYSENQVIQKKRDDIQTSALEWIINHLKALQNNVININNWIEGHTIRELVIPMAFNSTFLGEHDTQTTSPKTFYLAAATDDIDSAYTAAGYGAVLTSIGLKKTISDQTTVNSILSVFKQLMNSTSVVVIDCIITKRATYGFTGKIIRGYDFHGAYDRVISTERNHIWIFLDNTESPTDLFITSHYENIREISKDSDFRNTSLDSEPPTVFTFRMRYITN